MRTLISTLACVVLLVTANNVVAQNWLTTGNNGLAPASFLGTTDANDLIFKANNAERARLLNAQGAWRFGSATNNAKIDSAGKLSFAGSGGYLVGGNKYAFQYSAAPNYGLFFNSSNVQYEFRNGSAVPVFYVNANNGNSVFSGTLKVGAYTLPATDGSIGQVLKTDGSGALSWSTDNGAVYSPGTGISIASNTITNTAPDQTVTLSGTGATTVTGTYPNFTINSTDNNTTYSGGTGINVAGGTITNTAPDQTVALTGSGATTITGTYPNFTISSTDNNTTYAAGSGISVVGNVINNTGDLNAADDASLSLSNLTSTAINQTLSPNADNTLNLGAPFYNWKNVYMYGAVYMNGSKYLSNPGNASTVVGANAGFSLSGGGNNTFVGSMTGYLTTTGYDNTFIGEAAGNLNNTGYNNTYTGRRAGYSNSTGYSNAAFGHSAMYSNTSGRYNAALGFNALYSNKDGYGNSAVGYKTLYSNTIGYYNSAFGYAAQFSNQSGNNNSAFGYYALYSDTGGFNNSAFGYKALYSNNYAPGTPPFYLNKGGIENCAFGAMALYSNTSGSQNVAMGESSLYSNTTGGSNIAIGSTSLYNNTTGDYNMAIGSNALHGNTSGIYNIATGTLALFNNTTGKYNAAYGSFSMDSNTTGGYNVAIGYNSLRDNETGNYNTASGVYALTGNETGAGNTGSGYGAGFSTNASSYCSYFGYYADNYGDYVNGTAIGYNSRITASNQVRIGNAAVTSIGGYAGWSNISDERVKKDVKENVPGLEFINRLKPVTYHLNMSNLSKMLGEDRPASETGKSGGDNTASENQRNALSQTAMKEKGNIIYTGFIAQDVEKVAKSLNYDFSGVDAPKNDKDLYGLRYAEFVVPLVKAVQELSKSNDAKDEKIEAQDKKIAEQQKQNDDQQKEINELKRMFIVLQQTVQSCTACAGSSSLPVPNPQSTVALGNDASLEQNIPNPFSGITVINYTIPQQFGKAQLMITDKGGKLIKQINIVSAGKGSVRVDASQLASGAYQYTLYVDGKMVDSKQMEHLK